MLTNFFFNSTISGKMKIRSNLVKKLSSCLIKLVTPRKNCHIWSENNSKTIYDSLLLYSNPSKIKLPTPHMLCLLL